MPGRNRLCQIKLVWLRFRYCKWNLACDCSPMGSRDIKRIEEGRNRILPLLRKMKEVCHVTFLFLIMGKWKLPKMRGPKIQSQINYFIMAWIKHENRLPSMLDAYINPFQEPQPWYILCQKLAEWHCNENLKLFSMPLGDSSLAYAPACNVRLLRVWLFLTCWTRCGFQRVCGVGETWLQNKHGVDVFVKKNGDMPK